MREALEDLLSDLRQEAETRHRLFFGRDDYELGRIDQCWQAIGRIETILQERRADTEGGDE